MTGCLKMDKWNNRFLDLANHIAEWSKDPSTKVGAVIVDEKNRILGIGYNGFPRHVRDTKDRYDDKPTKYSMVVHAEVNAILNAVKSVEGSTIYISPLFTCDECAKIIIQSGIKRVISPSVRYDETSSAAKMYFESGVDLILVNE